MTSPRSLLPVIAVGAALALPSAAPAEGPPVSSVAFDSSGALVWTGSDAQNFMSAYDQGDGTVMLSDAGDGSIAPTDSHCWAAGMSYNLICEKPTAIKVTMGGARDLWYGSDLAVPITVDGGAGDDDFAAGDGKDTYVGGPGADLLKGGTGNDVLDGGDGNDEIHGDAGADQVLGGAGNDKLTADGYNVDPSADVIDGGAGEDTIVSEWSKDVDDRTPVSITLGGGADDGRPGENDDVRAVEHIAVNLAGTYVGSDGPDDIRVRQILDPVSMNGGAGDDQLRTGDGNDTLDGGTGADYLDGGYGDDHITGGAGPDVIHGDIAGGDCGGGIYGYCKLPYGNDTIDARDGEVDSVDCGAGTDTVLADAGDIVAPDCETVQRSSRPVPPGPGDTTGPQTTGPGGTLAITSLKARLAKGLTIRAAVPAAGKLAVKVKRGAKALASRAMRTPSAGTATMHLKFPKAARRAVRHKLTVAVTFTPTGGAALKRTRKVTLRR